MFKTPFLSALLLVFLSLFLITCSGCSTPDIQEPVADLQDSAVEILQRALQLTEGKAQNSDEFIEGSALIENALERFAEKPEDAENFKTVFITHIQESEPNERFIQLEVLFEYVNTALLKCRNLETFQLVWKVRQEILAEQHSAARTLLQKLLLGDNGQLLSLEPKNLPTDAAEIAKFLDASIIEKINQYTSDVKSAEKKTADADAAFNNKQRYDAPCQKMIEEITQIIEIASALSFSYWYEFLPLDSAESENPSRLEQLSDLITRLQRNQVIRYNLWATQVCQDQSNHQIQNFNTIDPSLLSPAVQAIYYQKVNDIIQKESYSLKENIRQLMTAKKTPLSAF